MVSEFAHHLVFIFVIYNVIFRGKTALGYSLLIKLVMWNKTEQLIIKLTYAQLIIVVTEIKEINRYMDLPILTLERYIQIVAAHDLHSYT